MFYKNRFMKATVFSLIILILGIISCGNSQKKEKKETEIPAISVPAFNGDSAYSFVEKQVAFGPRVPNTKGHKDCAEYLENKLKSYGADVVVQKFQVNRYDGVLMNAKNIIASFDSQNVKRIMLCAHWDTRPWADNDIEQNYYKAIDGANDGASGVAVLLEIARAVSESAPEVGIDIILFDAEDSGTPRFHDGNYDEKSWCLGSQYWSYNPHKSGYNARYGILLDMVGAENAVFCKEGFSVDYAGSIVKKIWNKAAELGYSHIFMDEYCGYITDDHVSVNEIARIPCVDIIHNSPTEGFGEFWHTVNDNMDGIDKNMLSKVGNVVLNVIYSEK